MRRKVLLISASLIIVSMLVALLPYNPAPWTKEEIRHKAFYIYERAAIEVPHFELKPQEIRNANIHVYEKVEKGEVLNTQENIQYRLAYQNKLFQNQKKLSFFDSNLSVRLNVNMYDINNVEGHGIVGSHDHHDASVRSNLEDILQNIKQLESNKEGFFSEIKLGIYCYKDATDILQHLATVPQTKSVPYTPVKTNSKVQELAEQTLLHFKKAQFIEVNSKQYWYEVMRGIQSYSDFIFVIQQIIYNHTSPLQRSIMGRWTNWKSFGPEIDESLSQRYSLIN